MPAGSCPSSAAAAGDCQLIGRPAPCTASGALPAAWTCCSPSALPLLAVMLGLWFKPPADSGHLGSRSASCVPIAGCFAAPGTGIVSKVSAGHESCAASGAAGLPASADPEAGSWQSGAVSVVAWAAMPMPCRPGAVSARPGWATMPLPNAVATASAGASWAEVAPSLASATACAWPG